MGNIVAMDYKNATVLISEAFIVALNDTITAYNTTDSIESLVA